MKDSIYFDNAATTPVAPLVIKVINTYFTDKFANPSSLHQEGQKALRGVEEARGRIAKFLGAKKEEIVFTSGATESNNIAIQGLARALRKKGGKHVITSSVEHPAVLETCRSLKKEGLRVTELPVNHWGMVGVPDFKRAITNDTFLVTIMYINNEVGTIEPISEIGSFLQRINRKRKRKIYFHTDAVQAISLLPCQVNELKVDLLSLSGHKIYGPKGVGALYIRKGTPLIPIQSGGHHEKGIRPGTINAPLIAGLGRAIELVERNQKKDFVKLKKLSDKIINYVLKNIPRSYFNGHRLKRSPAHINLTFENVEGESLLMMLDMKGISVSTGSACASGTLEPSPVLRAMGLSHEMCHGSIRISLGRHNTLKEVNYFLEILPKLVKKIRERSPLKPL
ncbi:MAG: cysteine desulfurase family protein [Candidatus Bathyarchaeota archaeon]|nr:cysteine desulfurase family protein [Candidatus Bathyarchaeota archaeon]